MIPGRTYRTSLEPGYDGHDVWALQLWLNANGYSLALDGAFGPKTGAAVKGFRLRNGLGDGTTAGPKTQKALIVKQMAPVTEQYRLPKYLASSLIELESGWAVGCVNWSVSGGVDCGPVQDRVEYSRLNTVLEARWVEAFGPQGVIKTIWEQRQRFNYNRPRYPSHSDRRIWELGVLWHNWPAGASKLLRGIALSESPATWVVSIGVNGVTSPADWARFYIARATALVEW